MHCLYGRVIQYSAYRRRYCYNNRRNHCLLYEKTQQSKGQNSEEGNLDRDNLVEVKEIDSDGSARVSYRGTYWKAFAKDGTLETGMYRIDHVEGTRLIIKKK